MKRHEKAGIRLLLHKKDLFKDIESDHDFTSYQTLLNVQKKPQMMLLCSNAVDVDSL